MKPKLFVTYVVPEGKSQEVNPKAQQIFQAARERIGKLCRRRNLNLDEVDVSISLRYEEGVPRIEMDRSEHFSPLATELPEELSLAFSTVVGLRVQQAQVMVGETVFEFDPPTGVGGDRTWSGRQVHPPPKQLSELRAA